MKGRRAVLIVLLTVFAGLVASSCLAQPEVDNALRAQKRLIKRRPDDARLHNDQGNLLLLAGETSAAETAYRRALELDPELVSAHFNLALLLQESGRLSKARRAYREALDLDPTHAWSHYQLGILNAHRGRRDRAIEDFARALRLDRRLTDPAYNPHILDNTLAPSATLQAYANPSSAMLVPRAYESPRRIVGLMVPEIADSKGVAKPKPERPLRRSKRPKKRSQADQENGSPSGDGTDG